MPTKIDGTKCDIISAARYPGIIMKYILMPVSTRSIASATAAAILTERHVFIDLQEIVPFVMLSTW